MFVLHNSDLAIGVAVDVAVLDISVRVRKLLQLAPDLVFVKIRDQFTRLRGKLVHILSIRWHVLVLNPNLVMTLYFQLALVHRRALPHRTRQRRAPAGPTQLLSDH